jgi:RimJ/RimL family protein N-acetyltransferase
VGNLGLGSIEIVPIEERHIEAYHEAVDSVARERRYLGRTEAPSLEDARAFVAANIEKGNPHFVAMVDGRLVGWCDIVASKNPVFAHCGTLGMGIVESCRGRGIGMQLITAALRKAKQNGLEKVELEVFDSNERAIALYRKVGFKDEGKKERSAKIDGRYMADILMGLFLDEFEA